MGEFQKLYRLEFLAACRTIRLLGATNERNGRQRRITMVRLRIAKGRRYFELRLNTTPLASAPP
jgi:hypothetical protein